MPCGWSEGYPKNTLTSYRTDLIKLCRWLDSRALVAVSKQDLQDYQYWLHEQGYQSSSRSRMVSALRRLFQYVYRQKLRPDDPSATLISPKQPKRLPKDLTEAQIDDLLEAPNTADPLELRDKAMLELLYATGLRVTELIALTTENVSLRQGVVRVLGKGDKERLVPMGESAVDWLEQYLALSRPTLLGQTSTDVFFSQ